MNMRCGQSINRTAPAAKIKKPGAFRPKATLLKKGSQPVRNHFLIFGWGPSAGGLEALDEFFSQAPADSGMASAVTTPQHPGHPNLLPELQQRNPRMVVVEARDNVRLEPNCVYVATPKQERKRRAMSHSSR